MLKLIGTPRARTTRVMWALEELGEEYELVPAFPHSEEIRAVNPAGKVPALVVDGTVLLESVAICQFLADRAGQLTFPAGTIERAIQDGYTQFIVDTIEGALWNAGKHTFVLPEDKRVPALKPVLRWEFARAMQDLEARFGDGPYLMGERFTIPDILMGHAAGWAKMAKFELPSGKIGDYLQRIDNRPAVERMRARIASLERPRGQAS
ncbi:MAG: glutathione S-transferase family protein [Geminicoccaceae bacterium]